MEQHKLFKMVHCGLFAALIFIGTQFMQVALPFGYFNFGDCLILLSALMLGRLYAMIAAAFGAALADVLSGYVIYAPATLIIKPFMVAAMAAVSGLGRGKRGKRRTGLVLLGVVAAESIMVCGYFPSRTISRNACTLHTGVFLAILYHILWFLQFSERSFLGLSLVCRLNLPKDA